MMSATSLSLSGSPIFWSGESSPEGLSGGPGWNAGSRPGTAPTCQSWGAMTPPLACTSSITRFQPARASSPQNRGTLGSLLEAGRSTTVPSDTISPTSAAARRA